MKIPGLSGADKNIWIDIKEEKFGNLLKNWSEEISPYGSFWAKKMISLKIKKNGQDQNKSIFRLQRTYTLQNNWENLKKIKPFGHSKATKKEKIWQILLIFPVLGKMPHVRATGVKTTILAAQPPSLPCPLPQHSQPTTGRQLRKRSWGQKRWLRWRSWGRDSRRRSQSRGKSWRWSWRQKSWWRGEMKRWWRWTFQNISLVSFQKIVHNIWKSLLPDNLCSKA